MTHRALIVLLLALCAPQAWALAQGDVRERLAALGAAPPSPATLDMAGLWKAEHARYRQLLQDIQLTLDAP